jgi:cell division protein FtsB
MDQARITRLKYKLRAYLNYLIVVIAILVLLSLFRNITETQDSVKTIEKRQAEADLLEQKNKDLRKQLEKVESPEFEEKQIRDQLGLARPGEILLVLPEADVLKSLVPSLPVEEEELPDPTWKKWFNLFF